MHIDQTVRRFHRSKLPKWPAVLGILLASVVLCNASCGTSSTSEPGPFHTPVPVRPAWPTSIDPPSAGYCLGSTALGFVHFDNEDVQLIVDLAVDALGYLFKQSCTQVGEAALTYAFPALGYTPGIAAPELYLSPGVPETRPDFAVDLKVANCTSQVQSSSFLLDFPFWVRVAPSSSFALQEEVFTSPTSLSGTNIQAQVARYLDTQYHLQSYFGEGTLQSLPYNVAAQPYLLPDQYLVLSPKLNITYMTGSYALWQNGQVVGQRGQWAYVQSVSFPSSVSVTFASGAQAAGLCAGAS
jgi:hypothetical protein